MSQKIPEYLTGVILRVIRWVHYYWEGKESPDCSAQFYYIGKRGHKPGERSLLLGRHCPSKDRIFSRHFLAFLNNALNYKT